jgi:hypothetical protein
MATMVNNESIAAQCCDTTTNECHRWVDSNDENDCIAGVFDEPSFQSMTYANRTCVINPVLARVANTTILWFGEACPVKKIVHPREFGLASTGDKCLEWRVQSTLYHTMDRTPTHHNIGRHLRPCVCTIHFVYYSVRISHYNKSWFHSMKKFHCMKVLLSDNSCPLHQFACLEAQEWFALDRAISRQKLFL